jgi:hypothetical protein
VNAFGACFFLGSSAVTAVVTKAIEVLNNDTMSLVPVNAG